MTEDSVIGTIKEVKLVKANIPKKDGSGTFNKYSVSIDGNMFFALDDGYKDLVGEEGEWKYTLSHWTDRTGIQHTDKTLARLRGNERAIAPAKKQTNPSKFAPSIIQQIRVLLDELEHGN